MKNLTAALALSISLIVAPVQAEEHEQKADWFVEANLIGILYHELGHALIDVLELPVLGQEEAAVDVLTVMLIDRLFDEEDATDLAYEVALGYVGGENGDPEDVEPKADCEGDDCKEDGSEEAESEEAESEPAFWDVHGTGDQRYYNTVCLFYGGDTDLRAEYATDMELPEARAEKCEAEYDLANASWGPILDRISGKGSSLKMLSTGNDLTIKIVTAAVAELNLVLKLPVEVTVRVQTCGEVSAFYNPDKKEIIFCFEYTAYLQDLTDRGYFQGANTGKWKMSGMMNSDY
ncbi:MAG: hypothetical protein HRU29_15450 [Rhizobiales bacterium]|nr:DUF4344 domain-containing metallopeptidase [Hyphomicrobiales bacterium]NRB15792.1 hypothetical protein [Hyphomicrobiales bacterium]